jgi:peptide/nickel transport system permease protein
MHQYIIRRLLLFIPTMFLVTLLVFLFMRVMPGDPALMILTGHTGEGSYTQEDLENLQHKLGTDRPLHVQYGRWVWSLLHGDLGNSFFYGIHINKLLEPRIYLTLELTALGIAISFVMAVPLGILSAIYQNSVVDYISRIYVLIGLSIPTFVVGLVTLYLLVRIFNWFPPLDYTAPNESFTKNMAQLIFPALAIAFFMMAFIARATRSAMLEVLREDYIRTARSKGLKEVRVLTVHALKNAFLPILTVTGWSFGILLAGEVIVESIFLLPGMGVLLLDSIFNRDYPVIQSEVFVIAFLILFLNMMIDIAYGVLDPRIRYT